MTYTGVLQTGDIDEAMMVALKYMGQGHHILASRHEYAETPDSARPSYILSDRTWELMKHEHEPIEYEVWVEGLT